MVPGTADGDSGRKEASGARVNMEQFQRAQLVAFAYQQAGSTGSINAMRAVCYVMANRVKAGWDDGGWIDVIQNAEAFSAHDMSSNPISLRSPALQGLLREIDDIWYGSNPDDETRKVVGKCLFWSILGWPVREWFAGNIVQCPDEHPRRGQVGTIILYE